MGLHKFPVGCHRPLPSSESWGPGGQRGDGVRLCGGYAAEAGAQAP